MIILYNGSKKVSYFFKLFFQQQYVEKFNLINLEIDASKIKINELNKFWSGRVN